MDDFITRREHKEYAQRIDAENERQNKRISALESTVTQIGELTITVKELAVNMANMAREQEKQNCQLEKQAERFDKIEGRDGEKWRSVVSHITTTVIGAIIAYLIAKM